MNSGGNNLLIRRFVTAAATSDSYFAAAYISARHLFNRLMAVRSKRNGGIKIAESADRICGRPTPRLKAAQIRWLIGGQFRFSADIERSLVQPVTIHFAFAAGHYRPLDSFQRRR